MILKKPCFGHGSFKGCALIHQAFDFHPVAVNVGDCIGPGWARSGSLKMAGVAGIGLTNLLQNFFVLSGKCDQNQAGGRRIKGEHGEGPFGHNFRNPGPFGKV